MSERWLDGSARTPNDDAAALETLVERLVGTGFALERAIGGMSTPVYRLRKGDECLYLRLSEELGGSMRAEAAVHEHLRAVGVSVPDVVATDDGEEINRGVMVVREISGSPLAETVGIERSAIVRAAGRDLALINGVDVEGFGWLRRDEPVWPPRGEDATYAAFVDGPSTPLALVADRLETGPLRAVLENTFAAARAEVPPSRLAHGDFDPTHIYQRGGIYTGVIDFGEMRGAESLYDVAFFRVQDPEGEMLEDLIAGYQEVSPFPPDFPASLRRSAIVIVAIQLCRWISRDGSESLNRPAGRWWMDRLATLLHGET